MVIELRNRRLAAANAARKMDKTKEQGMSPLRKARMERGMSIYQLAEAVGVSAASISRLERRLQSTSPATAARIAVLLGLSLEQILLPEAEQGEET